MAAALLAPSVVAAPPRAPTVVTVAAGADHATGFVAADDRVVTVAHVLKGGDTVIVDGRRATVIRRDDGLDLALLHVPGVRGRARVQSDADEVWVRQRPARIMRAIEARIDGGPSRPALELSADVEIGDSGAPVTTRTGRVAGIVFARSNHRDDTAYAVDAEALEDLLPLD